MEKKPRVTVEFPCEDCEGEGFEILLNAEGTATCSGCDGTGYQESYCSMAELKELLESA